MSCDHTSNYVGWWDRRKKWIIIGYDDDQGEEIKYCPFCGVKLETRTTTEQSVMTSS